MDTFLKILAIIGGLALVIGLICFCYTIFNDSKSTGNDSMDQMHNVTRDFQDSDKTTYNNLPVSGAEVTRAITKYGDELGTSFTITVKTLANPTGTAYSAKPTSFPEKGNSDYINPSGKFVGSITYNSNKAVSGIVFTQQK